MLNSISFSNYKAFTEGEVKIRPITILLGANSVGKSSIMQLLLMLQQTALSEGNYKSALKLHGGFVSLGEGVNLIRKKDENNTLTLGIDFYNGRLFEALSEEYLTGFCEEVFYFSQIIRKLYNRQHKQKTNLFQRIGHLFSNSDDDSDMDFYIRMSSKKNALNFDRETFLELINDTHSLFLKLDLKDIPKEMKREFPFYSHLAYSRNFYTKISPTPTNHFKYFRDRKEEYILTYDYLTNLKNDIQKGHFKISYDIQATNKILILKRVSVYNNLNEIISISFEDKISNDYKLLSIASKYFEGTLNNEILKSLKEIFNTQRTIFSFINEATNNKSEKFEYSIFSNFLKGMLSAFNTIVSDYFENDNINYVSPLRAHPKRYYFLDKSKINAYVDTLDGDAIAETLKENSGLRNQVNSWLKKFNLKVEVSQLQDIIHKLVVNQNSLSLDITDVGFGISQVLPVIIQGFLSHANSLTLIEQPEIHLHPKMQADLADLFIDIVLPNDAKGRKASKYLFIETHSEYLLKRLRRRISDGTISSDDVAIYLIDPQTEEKGATIKELIVKERGEFDWPVDFYGGELLKDTTEFIKNQQKVK